MTMATITEDFCSFEVAKLLKEKGFDVPVNYEYHYKITIPQFHRKKHNFNGIEYSKCSSEWYSAPTHQMAMKWLREMHNINIDIVPIWNQKRFEYQVFVVTPENAKQCYIDDKLYLGYEDAVEAALKYALENLI